MLNDDEMIQRPIQKGDPHAGIATDLLLCNLKFYIFEMELALRAASEQIVPHVLFNEHAAHFPLRTFRTYFVKVHPA